MVQYDNIIRKLKTKTATKTVVDHLISEYPVGARFDIHEIMQTLNSRYTNNLTQRELGNFLRNSSYCEVVTPSTHHPLIYQRIVPTLCEKCGKGMILIEGYGYRCNKCHVSIKFQP